MNLSQSPSLRVELQQTRYAARYCLLSDPTRTCYATWETAVGRAMWLNRQNPNIKVLELYETPIER